MPDIPENENDRDVALMAAIAGGDHEAFAELVGRHQHAVVGTVSKMMNGSPDAEDIAQQVFLRLWKSAKRYQPTAKFTTYMYTITRNLVFNASRKKSIRKESSIEEQAEEWNQQVENPNEDARPDNELSQKELQAAVDRAIANLPEKQRIAVILRRYEQMPYEEIAEVLGLSVSAVKSLLFRARTQLRDELERYLES